jgi:hypothetical protein
LSHTIGQAVLYGLFTSNQPFIRTPKRSTPHPLMSAFAAAYEETLLLIAFILAIVTLSTIPRVESPDYSMWLVLLGVQCIPYAAALFTSIISVFPVPARVVGKFIQANGEFSVQAEKT